MTRLEGWLKVLRLSALVVWVGGLIFFAFVLAPVAFRVLPSVHEAGLVVGASLRHLHAIGFGSGLVYLGAATIAALEGGARSKRWWVAPAVILLMMTLTGISQWGILPRMEVDRAAAGGDLARAAPTDPARVHFDRLHRLSEKVEGGVLLLGLGVMVLLVFEGQRSERSSDFVTGRSEWQ